MKISQTLFSATLGSVDMQGPHFLCYYFSLFSEFPCRLGSLR